MKKLILLILGLSYCLNGFTFIPTIEKGNFFKRYINPGLGIYWRFGQLLQCDTIFAGQNYLSLYNADSLGNALYYVGIIREDTSSGRIYFKADTNNVEHLIIDYSLNVGDSIYNFYKHKMDYVVNVFYQNIFSQNRRCVKLQSNDQFVEGIGSSLEGLIPDTSHTVVWVSLPSGLDKMPIQCFPLGISEQANEIKFYPNPTENYFTLENDRVSNKIVGYKLFDLYGNQIQSSKNIEQRISISNLLDGIYFLECEFENGERLKKKLYKR